MPTSRPNVRFEEGVCGACLFQEVSDNKEIDWESRERELREIAEWAKKTTKMPYDCVIGISGGKDSTFQALYARDRLGLRPLLVNSEPEGITEIGRYNVENIINLGFDTVKLRPNPRVMKKMVKKCFYEYLNPVKITEYSLWSSAYIVASLLKIPLIIQGENPVFTVGSDLDVGTDGNALNANKQDTLSTDWKSFIEDEIDEKDLFMFHYDKEELEKAGVRGVWLGYYAKEWAQPKNAMFSMSHGLRIRPPDFDPNDIGTYCAYMQLDSDLVQVNQMLKYIKFGFGQCVEHICYDLREGRVNRSEAIALVREYDGKCAERYVQKFCDYIDITLDEFWRVANSFRGDMWEKTGAGEWRLKDPIWEQEPVDSIDLRPIVARLNSFR